jgi:acyl-CoA synthetase (NDP forming)
MPETEGPRGEHVGGKSVAGKYLDGTAIIAVGRLAGELAGRARAEGREALTDLEGMALLDAMGIDRPFYRVVKDAREALSCPRLPGNQVVVKVISPEILHKTELGGVAVLPNDPLRIEACVADMISRFKGRRVEGYTINEFIPYEPRLGYEIIVGYRFAQDFGPIVSFGPGGIHAEFLAKTFRAGTANLFFSPETADRGLIERELAGNAITTLVAGGLRNTRPALASSRLADLVEAFVRVAPVLAAAGITEFEVNPFVIAKTDGGGENRPVTAGDEPRPDAIGDEPRLVALDILAKVGEIAGAGGELVLDSEGRIVNLAQAGRPLSKIDRILSPRSAAIIGVSEKGMNNGRIILNNLIHDGFDRKRLYVVKAGTREIDGCACVPDLASLPDKVDLFVLVIPSVQAAETIALLAELDKAESIIVIPGGLEEKEGTAAIVRRMRTALAASRKLPGGGPLVNGGNCLGIRSVPGRYNTLFIPAYKLPMPSGSEAPFAIISQSGAFAICRISKHPEINPKYTITCGNQMDLTIGDYLERLADDPDLRLFAVYVEGFKPLDGKKLLVSARRIVESGRTVIFYRAGRTAAGAAASASHTASIAGDYPVTKALLESVGVVVAGTLDEFDDAITTFALLEGKTAPGVGRRPRLGALSNAGFECVAFADNLGSFELAPLSPATASRLERVFDEARISGIVDVHNPLDLTPMAGDRAYEESFRAIIDDPNVDAGVVGIVPLSVMMNTLAPDPGVHGEDVGREDSVAARYGRLMRDTDKPWVSVVDSGALYDPLVRELEGRGVPAFRTADRALAMLDIWTRAKSATRALSRRGRSEL